MILFKMYKTQSTEQFYKEIINKVLEQSKEYFSQYNVNDEVLLEMKKVLFNAITNIKPLLYLI